MRHTVALSLLLISLALLAGCQSTPTSRWAIQRDALTKFQDAVGAAHDAGAIDDEALVAMDVGVQAMRAWLAAAQKYLPDGGDSFDAYIDAAGAALVKLQPIITQE